MAASITSGNPTTATASKRAVRNHATDARSRNEHIEHDRTY
jgi:hypothetical protein